MLTSSLRSNKFRIPAGLYFLVLKMLFIAFSLFQFLQSLRQIHLLSLFVVLFSLWAALVRSKSCEVKHNFWIYIIVTLINLLCLMVPGNPFLVRNYSFGFSLLIFLRWVSNNIWNRFMLLYFIIRTNHILILNLGRKLGRLIFRSLGKVGVGSALALIENSLVSHRNLPVYAVLESGCVVFYFSGAKAFYFCVKDGVVQGRRLDRTQLVHLAVSHLQLQLLT